jgi:hypothetical protein
MSLRDRFYTARTAEAILSWRILLGIGLGVVAGLAVAAAGGGAALAIGAGVAVGALGYVITVARAMPATRASKVRMDPFTLSEPWRQLVQGAQRAGTRLRATVDAAPAGPLRARLVSIAEQLQVALQESWEIAQRGDAIDDQVRALDPTALRSKRESLRARAGDAPSSELEAAVASVESQLATADRLKVLSAQTADRLRLTQARMDELVARAAEVSVGASDTDAYAHAVDDLVIELEALRLAVEETREA